MGKGERYMYIENYQAESTRTMKFDDNVVTHCCMGISGEAGEVIDLIKKSIFYGKELDKDKVSEEIGDIMFYIVNLATALNLSMSDILRGNVEKLRKRYPNGFSEEDAIKRVDVNGKDS